MRYSERVYKHRDIAEAKAKVRRPSEVGREQVCLNKLVERNCRAIPAERPGDGGLNGFGITNGHSSKPFLQVRGLSEAITFNADLNSSRSLFRLV